jgi:hypothetical protein
MVRARTGFQWSTKRAEAALLRSEGKSWAEIAQATGLALRSAANLTTFPAFALRVQELTDERVEAARTMLKRKAEHAAAVIIGLLDAPLTPSLPRSKADEVRLNAARDILDRLGVTATRDAPPPAFDLNIDLDVTLIDAAEAAFIATLRAQSAALGESLYAPQSPDTRHRAFPPLPVSGRLLAGPESGADGAQGPADGHEPGGGA